MANGDGQGNQPGGVNQQGGGQGDYKSGVEGFESPAVPEDDGGHPLADNNFDVNAFADVLKLTFNRLKDGPVLIALVGLASISLLWSLMTGGIEFIAYLIAGGTVASILSIMGTVVGILMAPLFFVVTIAQWALYRPAAHSLFDGSIEVSNPVDVIKSTTGVMIPVGVTMIIVSVGSTIGLVFCILPGLAIGFLFIQAPYLAAVHDRGVVDALKESFERGKKHWHVVVMAVALMFVVAAASGMIYGCVGTVVGFIGAINLFAAPVLQWLSTTLLAVAGFVIYTGAFATIDELEGIATIER